MNKDLKAIIKPSTPLLTWESFVKYWDYWYYLWQTMYYANSFKKSDSVLGWKLPQFFGNNYKTIKSYQYSPIPYCGTKVHFGNNHINLKIHPILDVKNANNHLFLNNEPFHNLNFHTNSNLLNFYVIPWQSFNYHTDIAEYLYDARYLKSEPHLVENKVLIPMLILNASMGNNKVIYTESNYMNSLLLVNDFEYISSSENMEKNIVIENGIKYRVFTLLLNDIETEIFCKTF